MMSSAKNESLPISEPVFLSPTKIPVLPKEEPSTAGHGRQTKLDIGSRLVKRLAAPG